MFVVVFVADWLTFSLSLDDRFRQAIRILPSSSSPKNSTNYGHLDEEIPVIDPSSFQPERTLWTIYPSGILAALRFCSIPSLSSIILNSVFIITTIIGKPVVLVLSYSPLLFPLSSYIKHNINPHPSSPVSPHSVVDINGSKYRMLLMIEASYQDPVIANTLRRYYISFHFIATQLHSISDRKSFLTLLYPVINDAIT